MDIANNKSSYSSSALTWCDMDHNVLTRIFRRISDEDLVSKVSWVCRSWQIACWEVLFWKNDDVLDLECFIQFSEKLGPPPPPPVVVEYSKMEIKAMKLIKSIFEGQGQRAPLMGWSQSLHSLLFPRDFRVSDRILLYIAKRTTGLNTVSLSGCDRISGTGFRRAITHWNHIKFMVLGPIDGGFSTDIIRHIGRFCKVLEDLHLHIDNFMLDQDYAKAMAMNLPRLKTLAFLRCSICKSGIEVLANQCRELDYVRIERCLLVEERPILTRKKPRQVDFAGLSSRKLQFRVVNDIRD